MASAAAALERPQLSLQGAMIERSESSQLAQSEDAQAKSEP
jgi:hypothetical protein